MGKVMAIGPTGWSGTGCQSDGVATIAGVGCLLKNIISVLLPIVALGAVVMVFVAGFQLITSGGDQGKLQQAKATLTYAFAGLLLAILAWFILLFIGKFTGVDVTKFSIGS
jgi:hypothetical protein